MDVKGPLLRNLSLVRRETFPRSPQDIPIPSHQPEFAEVAPQGSCKGGWESEHFQRLQEKVLKE